MDVRDHIGFTPHRTGTKSPFSGAEGTEIPDWGRIQGASGGTQGPMNQGPEPQSPPPWRRPAPLPEVVAETERLLVRCPRLEDDEALFEAVSASRQALLPWLPWARDEHKTIPQSRRFLELMAQDRAAAELTNLVLFIEERASGALVGGTGLHRIDATYACAEIGYWIHVDHRRRGYCREAVAGLLTAAFDTFALRRIRICCGAANWGSRAVIERLGLRLEARERLERFVPGHGWMDSLSFAALAEEWSPDTRRVTHPLPPGTD